MPESQIVPPRAWTPVRGSRAEVHHDADADGTVYFDEDGDLVAVCGCPSPPRPACWRARLQESNEGAVR